MALFNFGKKKEEEKKAPACACSCGCPQVKQKKSQMTAALKQRTESAALRCWAQAVNPATSNTKTQRKR